MNYHLFSTIETNGAIDAIRHEFCSSIKDLNEKAVMYLVGGRGDSV